MEKMKTLALEVQARVDAFSARGIDEANLLVETHNLIVKLRQHLDMLPASKDEN